MTGPEVAPITVVPILLYHSVSSDPSPLVRPFTVTADVFAEHLDSVVELGCTSLTVSQFREAMRGVAPLPDQPVLITFDDGFADFQETALPALRDRGLASTLYLTTGFLEGRPEHAVERSFSDRMLAWSQVAEIAAEGVEIGAHSHAHAHLDTLALSRAGDEVKHCKALLEEELGATLRTFAYPHGYSSPAVRRLVREAAYESACGVKNALSSTDDDPFSLARLTVRDTTTLSEFRAWLAGTGARAAPSRERIPTRLWRLHRRLWSRAH